MSAYEWQEIVGVIGVFALLIVVVATIVWQLGATARTKAVLKQSEEHRQLAERAFRAQEETGRQLSELGERVTDVQSRIAAIERVLKEVD